MLCLLEMKLTNSFHFEDLSPVSNCIKCLVNGLQQNKNLSWITSRAFNQKQESQRLVGFESLTTNCPYMNLLQAVNPAISAKRQVAWGNRSAIGSFPTLVALPSRSDKNDLTRPLADMNDECLSSFASCSLMRRSAILLGKREVTMLEVVVALRMLHMYI